MNTSAQIESLLQQGHQARREHRSVDARAAFAEAVSIAQQSAQQSGQQSGSQSGIQALLAQSLMGLGRIERDLRETQSALAHYQEAAAILGENSNSLNYAHAVRHIGDIARDLDQLPLAQSSYEEALAIYRSHPEASTLDLANCLRGHALLHEKTGDTQQAIALWHEAGNLYDKVWQEPNSPYSQADLAPGVAESASKVAQLSGL